MPRVVFIAPAADPDTWPPRAGDTLVAEWEQDEALAAFAAKCEAGETAHFIVEAAPGLDYAGDVAGWATVVLGCGDAVLIVDELEEVVEGGMPEALSRLLWRGRKVGAWLWGAAHRPVGAVVKPFTASADLVAFRPLEPRDFDYYDDLGLEFEQFEALPEHHAIVRTAKGQKWRLDPSGRVFQLES